MTDGGLTGIQQLRCKIPLYDSKNQTPTEYAYARHSNLLETCEKWSMPAAPKKGSQNRSTSSFAKNFFLCGDFTLVAIIFSGWWQPKYFFEFSPRNLGEMIQFD